jgi:hypothetical protein
MDDWKNDLRGYFEKRNDQQSLDDAAQAIRDDQESEGTAALASDHEKVATFYRSVVEPAFQDIKTELEHYGQDVRLRVNDTSGLLSIKRDGERDYNYEVHVRTSPEGSRAFPVNRYYDHAAGTRFRMEGFFRSGGLNENSGSIGKGDIISNFLEGFKANLEQEGSSHPKPR